MSSRREKESIKWNGGEERSFLIAIPENAFIVDNFSNHASKFIAIPESKCQACSGFVVSDPADYYTSAWGNPSVSLAICRKLLKRRKSLIVSRGDLQPYFDIVSGRLAGIHDSQLVLHELVLARNFWLQHSQLGTKVDLSCLPSMLQLLQEDGDCRRRGARRRPSAQVADPLAEARKPQHGGAAHLRGRNQCRKQRQHDPKRDRYRKLTQVEVAHLSPRIDHSVAACGWRASEVAA